MGALGNVVFEYLNHPRLANPSFTGQEYDLTLSFLDPAPTFYEKPGFLLTAH